VAVGDLNGDGKPEIAVGSDAGGGPRIAIFDGAALNQGDHLEVADFFSGDPNSRGGIRIAIRDVDGDGVPDLVTGDGPGTGSTVRVYSAAEVIGDATPVPEVATEVLPGYFGGVYVA
jgi:hypothetical protein